MKKLINKQNILKFITYFILPFFINLVLESCGNKSLFGGIIKLYDTPIVFLCNTLIIASTISIGAVLGRFKRFWILLASLCWLLPGIANYILICNRVLPFTAYDLKMVDVLPLLLKKYVGPAALAVISLFVVVVLLALIIMLIRSFYESPRKAVSLMSFLFVISMFTVTCGCVEVSIRTGILEKKFPDLAKSFVKNGFAYSFTVSIFDNGIDKVDGYSEKLIDSITDPFDSVSSEDAKTPNIIFLQMESFFDVNALKNVSFSSDPIPNFTALLNENPSGLLTVPVIGAGTVNTEFEVVTGMRVADFGAGEYPYKTILTKSKCESLAYNLKSHGYKAHFIHNYKGTFYGRNKVYANLGYDKFCPLEYMTGYEKNEKGWSKDKILLKYINECLDSTDGTDLITAISVQGHGSYNDITEFTKHVTVTKIDDKSMHSSYEYYINQLHEMDIFLSELVTSLSEREEETVLVIYGDHLPTLEITDDDLSGRSTYQTDYLIWNNMGIEYEDKDLYAYQLSSHVFEGLNITDGVINNCHKYYKDSDDYLFNLMALEYDLLYGKVYAYDGKLPYADSAMKTKKRDMTIESVSKDEDDESAYIIKGFGFSDKTYVRIGFIPIKPEFVNENTLKFGYGDLVPGTALSVWEKNAGESDFFIIE